MHGVWLGRPDEGPPTWDVVVRRIMGYGVVGGLTVALVGNELGHWSTPWGTVTFVLLPLVVAGVVATRLTARRRPQRLPAVLVPLVAVCAAIGATSVTGFGGVFMFAPISMAANRWRLSASAALTAGGCAAFWVGFHLVQGGWPSAWLLIAMAGSYLGGHLDGAYHDRVRAQAQLLEQTERARAAEARSAALAERGRIAREMHDVLAHSLAGLSVQLEAADALMSDGRGDTARDVVRRCRQLAREGLAETKQAVLALREGDRTPLPDSLRELAGTYGPERAWCTITGGVRELDEEAAFALYRIAQEALTNATKHAPGAPVELALDYRPDAVELAVRNGLPAGSAGPEAAGAGYGLSGMRERLEPLGGELTVGPVDGGWRVAAKIPV